MPQLWQIIRLWRFYEHRPDLRKANDLLGCLCFGQNIRGSQPPQSSRHTFFELQERRSIAAEKIWRFVSAR